MGEAAEEDVKRPTDNREELKKKDALQKKIDAYTKDFAKGYDPNAEISNIDIPIMKGYYMPSKEKKEKKNQVVNFKMDKDSYTIVVNFT